MSGPDPPFAPLGVRELEEAFRTGRARPSEVVRCCLEAIRASDADAPPLRAVIAALDASAARAAADSDERWRTGAPRSPLEGIPVLVKDNIDVAGVPTTNGTRIPFPLPRRDAWVVERLRAAGAVVVGKANQHELGAGTSGINPHHGTARNPFDTNRWCGGSSSGSACAVGAGLVPIAVGTDAGGSIRAPAAFVGAVGLKPTFGRVSRAGMSVLCDTVDTIGPIASSCADAAVFLAATCGVNPEDEETWDQGPLPTVRDELAGGVERLRIGVARRFLADPLVDPRVAAQVVRAGELLEEAGATLLDVELPDIERARLAGLIVLGAEGTSGLEAVLEEHRAALGADLQVLLSLNACIRARDYLAAQRARQEIRRAWRAVFDEVDLVLLPTAGMVAGPIRPDALESGELDEETSARAISFTIQSNLSGFPALSVPFGHAGGLPVGVQLVAPPWEELRLLGAGVALERMAPPRRRPLRYYGDLLLARSSQASSSPIASIGSGGGVGSVTARTSTS
jgi:Asp-tRNA(Asn)/Glu-tRNA(Gln) amidotransferase A subunit family amidase